MNKIIMYLYLLFLAVPALAANQPADTAAAGLIDQVMSRGIKISGPDLELAHKYISDLFGSFIFLPWGQGDAGNVTVLAHVVGFTNILALIMGLVIIFYVIVGGALQTAHSGEMLGRSWSTVWLPIRIGAGFGAIMPATGIGGGVLSVAQAVIIWLIVIGSNAASLLWEQTVDRIGAGTPLLSAGYTTGVKPTSEMLLMLACTDANIRNRTLNKKSVEAQDLVVMEVTHRQGLVHKMPAEHSAGVEGDSFRIPTNGIGAFIRQHEAAKILFADAGRCGSIAIEGRSIDRAVDEARAFGSDEVFLKKQRSEALAGARSVIAAALDQLAPVVVSLRSSTVNAVGIEEALRSGDTENSAEIFAVYRQAVTKFGDATERYSSEIVTRIHEKLSGSQSTASEWSQKIRRGGWIRAGTWFHQISNYSSQSTQTISDINSGIVAATSLTICTDHVFDLSDCDLKNSDAAASMRLAEMVSSGYVSALSGPSENVTVVDRLRASCGGSNGCAVSEDSFNSIHRDAARGIVNLLSQTSLSRWDGRASNTTGMASPFEAVTAIGRKLNSAALLALSGAAFSFSSSEAIRQTNSGLSGAALTVASLGANKILGGGSAGMLDYLKTVLLAVSVPLLVSGFVLAYLIPFLPVITWVSLVAGYLLTVIEACVAAPLAIILIVTPEGEGISGTRLERALQLIAMAILKPSLLVIGLIASITLSFVSFGILNDFFYEAAGSSLSGGVLDFLAIIVVYCIAALTLCKLCIGIMYKLSDQILDWFSSGTGRQFGEGDSAAVIGESIGNIKSGASSVAQGVVGRIAEKRRAAEYKK
ncbi:DotA/TraY family protein [Aeromonas rivipollensis]|uniref:DotA/TraY family protein n=1 Tax=Aeromonas rivipollensis TaxID=948519 RepID=UPI00297AEE82|nr:DotA/TraY family protein [Aeromonas rivipollensis]